MNAKSMLRLAVLLAASLAAVHSTLAGDFFYRGPSGPAWNSSYYDPAWGMPLAVVVPPRVRWQSNYAWGVGGSRLNRVGAQFQVQVPGPESVYHQGNYLPAPPQPSDTTQFGVSYVRGPRP
jgi:hypothetical protein